MREYEFRGKRQRDNSWIYGLLTNDTYGHYRIQFDANQFSQVVIPETIGQYTGLKDKNGTKIFEGDIVNIKNIIGGYKPSNLVIVTWGKKANGWKLKCIIDDKWVKLKYYSLPASHNIEVIGNIFDNPELLK